MFELASGQGYGSQTGTPGEDAFLQEAIFQLQADIRDEVFQVKPTGDPGPPEPQPVRIRADCEPPAQDVADHGRRDGPGLPPRPHSGLINRLALGGQIEPFPAGNLLDQRLLHRGQFPAGHLSDHTRTLISAAPRGSRLRAATAPGRGTGAHNHRDPCAHSPSPKPATPSAVAVLSLGSNGRRSQPCLIWGASDEAT
jgi:hypothetical protein